MQHGIRIRLIRRDVPIQLFIQQSQQQQRSRVVSFVSLLRTTDHLLFAKGNPQSPVIMGIIHSPLQDILACYEVSVPNDTEIPESTQRTQDVVVDGSRIVIEGREEVVLKCGDASITLTKSGKIVIRGKYLVNRSSGVNRIMGGSVQIN